MLAGRVSYAAQYPQPRPVADAGVWSDVRERAPVRPGDVRRLWRRERRVREHGAWRSMRLCAVRMSTVFGHL